MESEPCSDSDSRFYALGGNLKRYLYVLFGAYVFLVLWLTLIDREFGERRAMLVPFWGFANVIKGVERNFYIWQILGNLTMLIPLGFMVPMLKKISLKQILIIGFCFSAFIELTQFITGRGLMEFDDAFNNTVGAIIGYLIYSITRRCFLWKNLSQKYGSLFHLFMVMKWLG